MKECPRCGAPISESATRCTSCDTPLDDESKSTHFGLPTSSVDESSDASDADESAPQTTAHGLPSTDEPAITDEELAEADEPDVCEERVDTGEIDWANIDKDLDAPEEPGSGLLEAWGLTSEAEQEEGPEGPVRATQAGMPRSGSDSNLPTSEAMADGGSRSDGETEACEEATRLDGAGITPTGADEEEVPETGAEESSREEGAGDILFGGGTYVEGLGLEESNPEDEVVEVLEERSDAVADDELEEVDGPIAGAELDEALDLLDDPDSSPETEASPESPDEPAVDDEPVEHDASEREDPPEDEDPSENDGRQESDDQPERDDEAQEDEESEEEAAEPSLGNAESAPAPIAPDSGDADGGRLVQMVLGVGSGLAYVFYLVVEGATTGFPMTPASLALAGMAGLFGGASLAFLSEIIDADQAMAFLTGSSLLVGGLAIATLFLAPEGVRPGPVIALVGALAALLAAAAG